MITLRTPLVEATIDPLGAQLTKLRDGRGRDYLWHGDAKFWAGRAPILFPIVGTLNGGKYRHQGREYALSRHGFARGSVFDIVEGTDSIAMFSLRSSAATRAVYPFEFQLEMTYAVEGPTLSVTATIRNEGEGRMPASFGFHPGFLWPLPGQTRAGHFIGLEHPEPAPVRRLDAQGLLSPEVHPTPIAGRRLLLDDTLFQDDVLILDQFTSRRVVYGAAGGAKVAIGLPDAQYLGLWTKPGAPFICIEPWQGVADPAGFTGDLFDKPGIFVIEPGGAHSFGMTVTLEEEGSVESRNGDDCSAMPQETSD